MMLAIGLSYIAFVIYIAIYVEVHSFNY
jgi:hypothetical protein